MLDIKENYKFDLGVKGLITLSLRWSCQELYYPWINKWWTTYKVSIRVISCADGRPNSPTVPNVPSLRGRYQLLSTWYHIVTKYFLRNIHLQSSCEKDLCDASTTSWTILWFTTGSSSSMITTNWPKLQQDLINNTLSPSKVTLTAGKVLVHHVLVITCILVVTLRWFCSCYWFISLLRQQL